MIPDYFALYGLPETFLPDEAALRAAYYRLSREFHPDFHATQATSAQQQALEMATLNTDAYRVLSDFDRRMAYILRRHNLLEEGKTPELPGSFLAEVMDLNEQLMDLQLDPGTDFQAVVAAIDTLATGLETSIQPTLATYSTLAEADRPAALQRVLDYYLKRRYVARMREQVAKFAAS